MFKNDKSISLLQFFSYIIALICGAALIVRWASRWVF